MLLPGCVKGFIISLAVLIQYSVTDGQTDTGRPLVLYRTTHSVARY